MQMRDKKPRTITQEDVANLAGVSRGTVSVVLNGIGSSKRISEETHRRILAAAADLNYHPSAIAQGLAGKRMNTIGVAFTYPSVQHINNTYHGLLLDGFITTANRFKQNIMLYTADVWMDERNSRTFFCGGNCDGLLMMAPPVGSDVIPSLLAARFPFVLVNAECHIPEVTSVDIDNVAASRAVVDYLLDLGHRRIALVSLDDLGTCNALRIRGYREAHAARGILVNPAFVLEKHSMPYAKEYIPDDARIRFLMALPQSERPTALFCGADINAIEAVDTLREIGLRVPQDVSVVGFNDEPIAATCRVPLTTMRQPTVQMAERATELLMQQIEGRELSPRKEIFPTELAIRKSVARPRR